jgi:hypothetical protein
MATIYLNATLIGNAALKESIPMIVYFETTNGQAWVVVMNERGDVVSRQLVRRRKAA